jgi:Uma2 family endonuclease
VEEERGSYPSFTQVGWVIEVSLTTHQRDLGVKLRDYAWAGVSEYWVVNPEKGGWLLAHTDPGDGTYRQVQRTELPGGYRDLRFEEEI